MTTQTRQRAAAPASKDAWLDERGRHGVVRVGQGINTLGYTEQTPTGIEVRLRTGDRLSAKQLRDQGAAVGPVSKAHGSDLVRSGPTLTDAQLWMAVAGDPNWPEIGGRFGFVLGRPRSHVAEVSSEDIRRFAWSSSPVFAVYVCITNRSENDVRSEGRDAGGQFARRDTAA